jgi:pyroglutamyl-peptidase
MNKKLSRTSRILFSYLLILILIFIILIPSNISIENNQDKIFDNYDLGLSSNKTIFLTGFGPFHTYDKNPSQIVVENLNGSIINDCLIISRVLPIDFEKAPSIITSIITDINPDLIIMLGLAPNASSIRLETLAINLQYDPYIPHPYLNLKRIDKQGPFFVRSTLDIRTSYDLIHNTEIPVEISFSAGWYLCNTVFYVTNQFILQKQLEIPAGFVHIPQLIQDNPNGLSLETMIESVLLIIQAQNI